MTAQTVPLAERVRPQTLSEFIGQKHLVGEGAPLRRVVDTGLMPSILLWGPPGVGKTTLVRIIARELKRPLQIVNAVQAGVKDIRAVLDFAKVSHGTILFIDEIHRFNKAQQDALLHAVEEGLVTLIGATTENPSFEVISALLSRSQTYVLQALTQEEIRELLMRAITVDLVLAKRVFELSELESLYVLAEATDAKRLTCLNSLLTVCLTTRSLSLTNSLCKLPSKKPHNMTKAAKCTTISFQHSSKV